MNKNLRKVLIIISLVLALCGIFVAGEAFAKENACGVAGYYDPLICGYGEGGNEIALQNRVRNVLETIYLWIGIIAVVVIIIGGIRYMTSAGDPGKIAGAKNAIMYAIIGLVVTLAAFAITEFFIGALGGQVPDGDAAVVTDPESTPESGDDPIPPADRPDITEEWRVVSVTISKPSLSMKIGDTDKLTAKAYPETAVDTSLTWSSTDDKIATVDQEGNVVAKSAGTAQIRATSRNGIAGITRVTVINPEAKKLSLTVGKTKLLDEEATTAKVKNAASTVHWSSSNSTILKVEGGGRVIGKKPGTAKLIAKTKDSLGKEVKLEKEITVKEIKVLWVGNSKTYVSDIDEKFTKMAKNRGFSVNSTRIVKGGSTLHENFRYRSKNMYKYYDYLIMQEQTNTSLKENAFYNGALEITKAVKSKNKDVKVFVRKTWYTRNSKANANKVASNVANRLKSGAGVWVSTTNDGDSLYAAKAKGIDVFGDNIHQNYRGAYIAAACIASKVLGIDATKVTYTPNKFTSSDRNKMGTMLSIAKNNCYNK